MVKAKFYVAEVARQASQSGSFDGEKVRLQAAMGEENKEWSRWTPSGTIEMQITNEEASRQFVPGQHVFVTFEPIPKT